MYKMKFESAGHQVILAPDGQEGLNAARLEMPDLVLLDMVMPKMTGLQVLEQLRADPETKNLKIYVLSNLGQTGEISQGMKEGANGYLIKSNLTPTQLLEMVENVLKNKEAPINGNASPLAKKPKPKPVLPAKDPSQPVTGKVLLIEDEESLANIYRVALEKARFETDVAKNGAWGLKLAGGKPYDIIIMDVVMPAMDGCEAIARLKENEMTVGIPVVILSNSAQDSDIEKTKACGAASFLLKSQITPAKLVKEIKEVIRRSIK
jgi:CheY-like chemotaxis protein